jgi:alginate O-acetyltransferase complex protein AlgI
LSFPAEPVLEFDFTRLDGWFHLQIGEWDVPRGPLGVFAYLPFVPLFWLMPARATRTFLIATSLLVWYATLGPAFVVFLLTLLVYYFAVTVGVAGSPEVDPRTRRRRLVAAVLALHAPYVWLLFKPMPGFLPSLGESINVQTNYLHWCGLAYIHLKTIVVVVDHLEGSLGRITVLDYFAFMLFAPTFKMGPLYRYDHFVNQLADAKSHVQIRKGLLRIGIGLLRLGVMCFFFQKQIRPELFTAPETIAYYKLFISCALKPLELYFWLAGYCDIAVGMGLMMGFRVPEQFRGPWFVNNIADFWKRWSITLGRWLYDYPFRAMVAGRFPRSLCFVLTFLYCGFWHGILWSYVIWGLSQGVGLAAYHLWHRWWSRRKKQNGPAVTFLKRLRICDGPIGWWAAWLLLVSYQFLTIAIASDLRYAGARFLPVLFGL